MTLLDISRKIFDFFAEEEVFYLHKDVVKVTDVNILPKQLLEGMVREAMKSFEAQSIVSKINFKDAVDVEISQEAWVLNKPLSEYEQTITLSAITVNAIAQTVNNVLDSMEASREKYVNPLNITENAIHQLILLANGNQEQQSDE